MTCARLSRGGPAAAWFGLAVLLLISSPAPAYSRANDSSSSDPAADPSGCANLKEQVPKQYRGRYDRWKAVFLSSEVGHQLWLRYACHPAFHLTIILSESMDRGGKIRINDYRWHEGRLTAATITLGHRLDRGYPDPIYYPVLSSLYYLKGGWDVERPDDILAAAKITHEFGHVDQAAMADPARFRLQNRLSQIYASLFRSNGYDADDPALVEIAAAMGGTPTILSGQREYWAETYALRFLLTKFQSGKQRELLKLIRKSLASESNPYRLPSQTEWRALATFD
jgi:hypothetical protein